MRILAGAFTLSVVEFLVITGIDIHVNVVVFHFFSCLTGAAAFCRVPLARLISALISATYSVPCLTKSISVIGIGLKPI